MQKMKNQIQHYAWGSRTALTQLYGISNPNQQPMAELWMGAHPLLSSQLVDEQGNSHPLYDNIQRDPVSYLGKSVAKKYGELPFLFKVLAAAQPLSIQVHPDKASALAGFNKEQAKYIPLSAAKRNYKDANHKPELIYAVTPFQAMNGFRCFHEIAQLLLPVATAHPSITAFLQQPDEHHLAVLFADLLTLSAKEKQQALSCLHQAAATQPGLEWQVVKQIAAYYPDDIGLFTPLLLNVVTLQPGEAMFLAARTPHAYLQGVGLEVMANSDNVLRAGLTNKHIDVAELLANVSFQAKPAEILRITPVQQGKQTDFPVPVDDFCFSIYQVISIPFALPQKASILFCLEGEVNLQKEAQILSLQPGESCYISASDEAIFIYGDGKAAYAATS